MRRICTKNGVLLILIIIIIIIIIMMQQLGAIWSNFAGISGLNHFFGGTHAVCMIYDIIYMYI